MRVLQEHGVGTAVGTVTGRRRAGLVVGVATAVVVLDQLTKTWAINVLSTRDIDLFWGMRLHLTRNTRAAFSFGFGGSLMALLAIAVVIVFLSMGRYVDTTIGVLSLGLVLGGALGNLGDRAFRAPGGFLGGAVVDFVDPGFWPIFNVADAAISIGGVLLVLVALRSS